MLTAALVGLLAAWGAPSAGPDDREFARVGPISTTVGEFSRDFHYAAKNDPSLRPDRASLERYLEGYIETLLMHAYTLQDSSVLDPYDRFALELNYNSVLQRALQEHLLPRYMHTDEKTVGEIYDRLATDLRLAVVRVPTFVEVDSVNAALASGVSFGEVARRWSKDPDTSKLRGEIGWVEAARMPLEHQRVLWALPIGKPSPVIAEPNFHAIFLVQEKRPNPERKSLEAERARIVRGLATNELGRIGGDIHQDLLVQYGYRVDMDAAEWMRAFLEKETASARRHYDPNLDKSSVDLGAPREGPFWTEAPLVGEEAGRPVAFMEGDTLTALEVIDELIFKPTLVWPRFTTLSDVLQLCDDALYYRIQTREAEKLGLHRRPDIARELTNQRRWVQWRAYRRSKILPSIAPTDSTVRAIYEQQIDRFRVPERRRYVVVHAPGIAEAGQARDLLRRGSAPSTVVRELAGRGLVVSATPDTGMGLRPFGRDPAFDGIVFGLRDGEVSEPVAHKGGYSVVRLDQVSPAHTLDIRQGGAVIAKEITEEREKEYMADLLSKARAAFPVKIDRARLSDFEFDKEQFQKARPGPWRQG